jgi:MFS family permease
MRGIVARMNGNKIILNEDRYVSISENQQKLMHWILISQSTVIFGTSLVFPYYLIFIKELGANFSEYGMAYGLFTISSAVVHRLIGRSSDNLGRKIFLLLNAWGTAVLFLLFPIATDMWQVYVLQTLLGIFGAMQKTSEKAIVADVTDRSERGKWIGSYHSWMSIFAGLAVMAGGFLIDLLTIDIIFYLGSIILFLSGLLMFRYKRK